MIREKVKQRIKFYSVLLGVICVIAFAVFTVMKYNIEGEKVVPFNVGKIIVISSATTTNNNEQENVENQQNADEQGNNENSENIENTETADKQENNTNTEEAQNTENNQNTETAEQPEENYIWNEKVVQTNDIFIYLDKNPDYKKDDIIKSVKIDNIKILENVKKGKIQVYMPNSLEDGLYKYTNEYLVNSSLTYTGASADNRKALQVRSQGGGICISFANMGLGNYKSNDDQEIQQGGTILEKMNVSNEDLKFKVSFDLIVEVQDKSYKTNIVLELPIDGIVGQKETTREITDLQNLVFKRL